MALFSSTARLLACGAFLSAAVTSAAQAESDAPAEIQSGVEIVLAHVPPSRPAHLEARLASSTASMRRGENRQISAVEQPLPIRDDATGQTLNRNSLMWIGAAY